MSYGSNKYGEFIYSQEGTYAPPINREYNSRLMEYLTSNYQRGNTRKLMQIIEFELGELQHFSEGLGLQSSINIATWGLRRWEEELGIKYNPSLAYEERRENIKSKLRGRGTTTGSMIKNVAESFSGGEVDIIEYPNEHKFVVKFIGVRGIPRNMQGFIEMLEIIKPAHLVYSFKYTYTVWNHIEDKVWDQVNILTWDDLKIYEGE